MNNISFKEDARGYKKSVIIPLIILLICFIGILTNIIIQIKNHNLFKIISYTVMDIAIVLFCIYLIWALTSKYLKNFIFINNENIEFYTNYGIKKYNLNQLTNYNILKDKKSYMTIKLSFADKNDYEIVTFKPKELKPVLDYILENKN